MEQYQWALKNLRAILADIKADEDNNFPPMPEELDKAAKWAAICTALEP